MLPNVTLIPMQGFNFTRTFNGSFQIGTNLDILFQPEHVLIALYVPLILLSLAANILLIFIAVKCNYTKSVTNLFLVNLSAADLLVTGICMPIQLSKAFTLVWFYGETVCKIFNYIQGVAVAASVFTLTTMSVDRWLSISPEPRLRRPGRKQALMLLSLLWVVALLIFIPLILVASVQTETLPIISKVFENLSIETRDVHFCTEEWPGANTRKQFGTFSFTLVYAIPGLITILSYALMGRTLCSVRPPFDIDEGNVSMQQGLRLMKERKRVAWILLLLAVLFAFCWMPYHIMQLLLDVNAVNAKDLSMYLPYALFLGHANSAINPIVYCLMTRNFQRSAQKLLCGRGPCKQNKFTWRCTQKPEGSSSDYELYHEPHKRCYLQGLRLMKERKRVAWILLLLAVLFAFCWMPYHIMQLLLDVNAVNAKDLSMYLPYALFLGHANSAINPIVYCLMTRNFQRSAQKLLCGRGPCKQNKFTWRCTQKPEGSSSDYELYHEPHKRCYLQMNTLRYNGHTHPAARTDMRAHTQLSHVTRSSRRTAPAHALSVEMLQRHGHLDYKH